MNKNILYHRLDCRLPRPAEIIALESAYPLPHEAQSMSAQDVYNTCATHMLRQGTPALDPDDLTCRYRAGRMACGVGAVVPEAWYTAHIETMTINEILTARKPIVVPEFRTFLKRHEPLLSDIQSCHDMVVPEHWRGCLERIAVYYGLNWRCLAHFDTFTAQAYSPNEVLRRHLAQIRQ